ncbi:hypothetical protein CQ020_05920 [Arthrobacter sp. MYb23]|nr:hypothetical protein CQ038_08550 [Arthrobacter sp. MYb51]PRB97983.1 hypothetical protein CQ020_05920 [Arthrobacter sp. MYb23]
MQSVLAAQLAEVRYGPNGPQAAAHLGIGHYFQALNGQLLSTPDRPDALWTIGQQREPFVQGTVAPCPGIQSGRLAHQMVAQGFEGQHQRTFAANDLLSRVRNKLLRNRINTHGFERAEACPAG